MDLAERIKNLRQEKGMTQNQFAEKIEVERPIISFMETGRRGITTDTLIKICKSFNISSDYLLGLKNEKTI